MKTAGFHSLVAFSLVLPGIIIAGFLGAQVPEPLILVVVFGAAISSVAAGALSIWAVRVVNRDASLSQEHKKAWLRYISYTGPIAAAIFLRGYLRRSAPTGRS